MSALCIGGVCIPYSALLPLLAIVLKYLVVPLVKAGIIPEKVAKWFGLPIVDDRNGGSLPDQKNSSSSLNGKSCCTVGESSTEVVTTIVSEEHWVKHIQQYHEKIEEPTTVIFAKFTATWCGPCKKIEPQFHALAEKFSGKHLFVKIDVDNVSSLASQYNVVMMPTFIILHKEKDSLQLRDKYSGSDEEKLTDFVERNIAVTLVGKKEQ